MTDLAAILPELPRLAAECYTGPWQYEFEDCRATLTKFGEVTIAAIPGTHGLKDAGDLVADGALALPWFSWKLGWGPEGSLRRAHGLFDLLRPVMTGPTVFVGHSLGGAFAEVLALLWAHGHSQTPMWLETYGAPHAASADMVHDMLYFPGVAYENAGDPVPEITGGLWHSWRRPTTLGAAGGMPSIERHFMDAYRALLIPTVSA